MNTFLPDPRNSGGRHEIITRMNKHYKELNDVKPAVKCRRAPSSTRSRSTYDPYRRFLEWQEVENTYQKLISLKKGTINNSTPVTMKISERMTRNKQRSRGKSFNEHWNNVHHMQRRIADIGKMKERKKNVNDPVAYPALFFRKPEASYEPMATSISGYAKKVLSNRTGFTTPNRTSTRGTAQNTVDSRKFTRPASVDDPKAHTLGRFQLVNVRTPKRRSDSPPLTPCVTQDSDNPMEDLKEQVTKIIIHHRMYKEYDIKSLIVRTFREHPHLPQDELKSTLSELAKIMIVK